VETVPVAPHDDALAEVAFHLIPQSCRDGDFTYRTSGHLAENALAFVHVCRENEKLQVAITRRWPTVIIESIKKILDRLSGGTGGSGPRVEPVAGAEDVGDRTIDRIRIGASRKDDEEVDRPFAANGQLDAGQDGRHRELLVTRLPGQRFKLSSKVSISIDAVMIGECDQVHSRTIYGVPAGRDESFRDLGQTVGL
jgi:hypothetical protein